MHFKKFPELISVVISTYNAPEVLSKVLFGYSLQSFTDFEILIADDGSDPDTTQVIASFRASTSLEIRHIWHQDKGFRKCRILNRAIIKARGDYLLFTDGDCIPRSDFVEVHRREALQGRFLSGTYNTIPSAMANIITPRTIQSGQAFDPAWLRQNGMPWSRKCLRLVRYAPLTAALNRLTTTRPTWNGCNASGWKNDIVAVNGFDERMEYGGEDRELGLRLHHAGVKGKQIRYKAICIHVDHSRAYVNETALRRNLSIRQSTKRSRSTYTKQGICNAA